MKPKRLKRTILKDAQQYVSGRRGGLMVSALDSGFEPWSGTLPVVFLGKTLNSECASLHPGVQYS